MGIGIELKHLKRPWVRGWGNKKTQYQITRDSRSMWVFFRKTARSIDPGKIARQGKWVKQWMILNTKTRSLSIDFKFKRQGKNISLTTLTNVRARIIRQVLLKGNPIETLKRIIDPSSRRIVTSLSASSSRTDSQTRGTNAWNHAVTFTGVYVLT